MNGYREHIEAVTLANETFRTVLYTSHFAQLVVMSIRPGEEIGEEVHDVDQFFRFERGTGRMVIDGTTHDVADGDAVIVPAGARHTIINASASDALKLYTLYCPPHHKDGTVHATQEDAVKDTEHFDGVATEPGA